MIPNYQELMRPVLAFARSGEVHIQDTVENISSDLGLSEEERSEMLQSGKQTRITNRIHWARSYLKQAQLVSG
jgi:restriction system protein